MPSTRLFPPYAEPLEYFRYFQPKKVPSKFAPGAEAFEANYVCPACKADLGDIRYENGVTCPLCNLHVHNSGAFLHIWRDPAEAAE